MTEPGQGAGDGGAGSAGTPSIPDSGKAAFDSAVTEMKANQPVDERLANPQEKTPEKEAKETTPREERGPTPESEEAELESLLSQPDDGLPPELVKLKKDLRRGFDKVAKKGAAKTKEAEAKAAQLAKDLEDFGPLLDLWKQDGEWRQGVIDYVQKGRKASPTPPSPEKAPAKSKLEQYVERFSEEERPGIRELAQAIREDLEGSLSEKLVTQTRDPITRELQEVKSKLGAAEAERQSQQVQQLEERFNRECPEYQKMPEMAQRLFQNHLRAEFERGVQTRKMPDPVEAFKAFHKELRGLSAGREQQTIDELAQRPRAVPQPPGTIHGSVPEPEFSKGNVHKEAFWHNLRRQR